MPNPVYQLATEEFLAQSQGQPVLDVRSEGEYNYGHIPGATNLPLFNNEERKIVGTIYKQQDRQKAILEGLDIVGKKMSGFVQFAKPLVKENKIFIHCWRGGMRSSSMAWLFSLFGYEVYVLKGGYKAYRNDVLQGIGFPYKFLVLGGKTGSGKTEVLRALKQMGEQVIDLEALACHKGSAFGGLGQPAQPSTEQFENLLAEQLKHYEKAKPIWLEDESKTIGRVFLDNGLWGNMCAAPLFVIDLPQEVRIKRLVAEYAESDTAGLEQALTNIERRLGNEQWKSAMQALSEKDFEAVAQIALGYYDKAYEKAIMLKESRPVYRLAFEEADIRAIANEIEKQAETARVMQ